MIMIDLQVQPNENEKQYLWRIGLAIEEGNINLTWEEFADIMNKNWRKDESEYRSSSAYRKPVQYAVRFYKEVWQPQNSKCDDMEYNDLMVELHKERIKARDERTELTRIIREQARKESFFDLVKNTMQENFPISPIIEDEEYQISNCDNGIIVHLTDLHAGINIDNAWNAYNENILTTRLSKYLNELKEVFTLHRPKDCVVVLGGDLISGIIHSNLRIENNKTVIEQIKIASLIIAEFITKLHSYIPKIRVYSVIGNHSRLFPQKEQQIKGEYLDSLVLFNLETYFRNSVNVKICTNTLDEGIASFTLCNHLWYAVHGDKDNVNKVVEKLTMLTGRKPEGILMGHRHHNAFTSQSNVKVIESGCVSGMDNYCIDNRLVGTPEQMVVVTNKNKLIKSLYDIQLV